VPLHHRRYRRVELSFGTRGVTETGGEIHRTEDGDVGPDRVARLVGEFREDGLRVGSALLPGDRHRLDDLRPHTAGGNGPLGEGFCES
jgi:hypothetical protein